MAPQPKRKHSSRRARMRGMSIKLHKQTLAPCLNCKEPIQPHVVCRFCGFYDNRAVIVKKEKAPKENENPK
ncbi:50S ribosomal protein L32 [Candidatus Microgenomates bacterium]|nr:50S ribosomal protein L32 [Candidatus Microgenomates bacterium]